MSAAHIMILSGSMGGHPRIAQAITAALGHASPEACVETVDVYASGFISRPLARTTGAYEQLVASSRNTWRMLFHLSNQPAMLHLLRRLGTRMTQGSALDAALSVRPGVSGRPDVLVRVIADLGQEARLARMAGPLPPVVTVVSDLTTLHRGWLSPETQLYVLPTEESRAACLRLGVPDSRLRVLGFPIRSELFCQPPDDAAPRPSGDAFRVLMMGGSSGSGRMVADARRLLARPRGAASRRPLELTVVCGRNNQLRRRLERLAPRPGGPTRLQLLGYTDDIPQLMRASDVLVTKAGPSTLYEAAACGLPVIVNSFLPGQESGNADVFVRAGVALKARRPVDTARLVHELQADPARLRAMRNPDLARQTCEAAGKIALAILEAAR
jgi:1,2-diacylglycerol 3-beta-galactosyltransferase